MGVGKKRWMTLQRADLICCLMAISASVHAQRADSVKVVYPDETSKVENISEANPYHVKDSALLTPDDWDKQQKAIQTDSKRLQKKIDRINNRETKKPKDWSTWKPNPKRALWLALVVPGAGQIYNRKYWKLPIFYGGFLGCVYALTWNNQMYRDYAQAYKDIMDSDPNTHSYDQFLHLGTTITDANKTQYQSLFKLRKDKYRRWRDLSIFATIGVYALSVIDAYVDASLSDFNISDNLSLHIAPAVINDQSIVTPANPYKTGAIGIGCNLKF